MKLKFLISYAICVLATTTMYASSNPGGEDSYDKIILDFIDSHMNSDYRKLDMVLNDEARFKITIGEKVVVMNKQSLVRQMKKDAGTRQICESNYAVLAKSRAIIIARVDFKYENTIQHDYLLIEKRDNEWEIIQACKIFDDVKEPEPSAILAKFDQ